MRTTRLCMALFIAGLLVSTVFALPPERSIEMKSGKMFKVVFDGSTHVEKGVQCNECHPDLFEMKIGSTKISAPHKPGEFCGACHDGKRAFNQADDCGRCHHMEESGK